MSLQQCKVYSALIDLALASNPIQKLWNRYYWSIKHLLLVLEAQSHALDRINKPLLSHSSGLFPREVDQKTVIFAWFMGTLLPEMWVIMLKTGLGRPDAESSLAES